jgi:energy-coupling factor transporter ATP-binding protein EcfA2
MTSLVQAAKRAVGRGGGGLVDRLDGLEEAVRAGRGRLPDDLVEEADALVSRAGARLRLSSAHTVVALAGATGSGKSSTFNALAGLDISATGVRRPTTSWTTACVWGPVGGTGESDAAGGEVDELLAWLGVPPRHRVAHGSALDAAPAQGADPLDGLVLLDLPDHDSTEVAHHVEVDRVLALADLMIWVLDPQKYADAAVHERYLRPLAGHRDVVLVTLNHVDEVPVRQRPAMVGDLRRLLAEDGLGDVPVIATSARHGDGMAELEAAVAERVRAKRAARDRLRADVAAVAARLQAANGDSRPGDVVRDRRHELVDAFADAAGVPTVVRAVEQSTRRRAAQATGWPVTAWLGRLRPDPLRRLHLDLGRGGAGRELVAASRASVPEPTRVQRARVDMAVRRVADDVGAELSPPWADAVRRASVSRLPDLDDELDRAVGGVDLGVHDVPGWWRVARSLQWLLLLVALAGAVWLGALAVLGYLRVPEPATPEPRGLPLPTLLLVGGVVLGLLLALLCRIVARLTARARARGVDRRLRAAITEVTDRLVVEPIEVEVEAYRATRDGLGAAVR